MSASFTIDAELRTDTGKGASRRLRRSGRLPGIIYGAHQEPTMISLQHHILFNQLDNEAFYSNLLTLNLQGRQETVILKDMQRPPAKPYFLHVDFQRVQADEKIRLNVPLRFINEETCPGVKMGGQISHTITDLEVSCLPRNLPEYIEVDMGEMELGDTLHISELKLPEGAESTLGEGEDLIVVSIHTAHAGEEEGEQEGEEGADEIE